MLKIQEGSLRLSRLFKKPLTHSFNTILDSIVMLPNSLHHIPSLSHYCHIVSLVLVIEELGEHCCYNLFPFNNTEIALEELGVLDFVYMLHLHIRGDVVLVFSIL